MRLCCVLIVLLFSQFVLADESKIISPASEQMSISLPQSDTSVRLSINGRNIVDSKGNIVKLRGIYTRSEWLSGEQEVEMFKSWGINFVRILLTFDPNYWQTVNDGKKDVNKRCILLEENLRYMDQRAAWLEKNKIYFMIEVHWRAMGADDNLEKPDLLGRQFAKMYETLAKRYSSLNYLMGFSTLSEIHIKPNKYKDYNKIRMTIVDAIHKIEPRFIVSVTGTWWGSVGSLSDKIYIDRPNTMYDFHFYSPRKLTHYRPQYGVIKYPGIDYLKNELKPALELSKKHNVPVWCGEFGAFNNAPNNAGVQWMRDTARIYDENNIPWIIWTWKKGLKDIPPEWKKLWNGNFIE